MLKLALASLAAIAVTFVFGIVLSTIIPGSIPDGDCSPKHGAKSEKKSSYTMEELDRAEVEAKKIIACLRNKTQNESVLDFLLRGRDVGKWFTWLPWLCVPFLSQLRSYRMAVAPISVLIAFAVLRILLPIESILSCVALIAAVAFLRRRGASGTSENA